METLKVKPVLVECNQLPQIGSICKNNIQLFIWTQKHIDIDVVNTLPEYKNIQVFKLILISTDKHNTKIGEVYPNICNCSKNYVNDGKIIATQSKIPEDYINTFIEQYNNNCVEDIEIKMQKEAIRSIMSNWIKTFYIPKLTNGFITIANKNEIKLSTQQYYSEDEMKKIVFKLFREHVHFPSYNPTEMEQYYNNWFQQNKK